MTEQRLQMSSGFCRPAAYPPLSWTLFAPLLRGRFEKLLDLKGPAEVRTYMESQASTSSASAAASMAAAGMQPGQILPDSPLFLRGRSRDGTGQTEDPVRTIFITGFPQNVRDRELHNLVRYLPGYEASQMSSKAGQAQGFALFTTHWHACQAQEAIAGTPFEVALVPPAAAQAASHLALAAAATAAGAATKTAAEKPMAGKESEGGQGQGEGGPGAVASKVAWEAKAVPVPSEQGQLLQQQQQQQQQEQQQVQVQVQGADIAPGDSKAVEAAGGQGATSLQGALTAEVAAGRLKEGVDPSHGAAAEAARTVIKANPYIFRLRCELAHKNLHYKEGDPTIHRPHRQLQLLPSLPSHYMGAMPMLPQPTGSIATGLGGPGGSIGGTSMGGGIAAQALAPFPVAHGAGAGYGARPSPTAGQPSSARTAGAEATPTAAASATATGPAAPHVYAHPHPELVPAMEAEAPLVGGAPAYRDWSASRGPGAGMVGHAQRAAGSGALAIDPRAHQQQQQQQQQPQPQPLSIMGSKRAAPYHAHASYAASSPITAAAPAVRGGGGMILGGPLGFLPVTNRGDNPPCNTLFVGNLSDTVSEVELCQLFSAQPGYRQMKLVRGPKQVSCFVEFDDLISATTVHQALQGAVLATSERGGIRIQFSKNPYGRRSPHVTDPMAMAAMCPPPGAFAPYSGTSWAAPLMPPPQMPHMPPY